MESLTVGDLYDRCTDFYEERVALQHNGEQFTFQEIGLKTLCLGEALRKLGLKKGDKAAFLMQNCPEYIFCEYALAKMGVVRVPLAVLLGSDAHIYMMNHAECTTLIYHEKMTDRVLEMIPSLETVRHFICVSKDSGAVPTGHMHLQSLIADSKPVPFNEKVQPEDLCGIYYTGGTTGLPKGVMLSHRSWVFTYLLEMLELGLEAEEKFAFVTPLTHGAGCLIMPVLLRRGICVIVDHFEPEYFLKMVEQEKITSTFIVPTMIYAMLDCPNRDKYDLSSLRNVVYGAAAIAPDRLKAAVETFGPIFTQLYGQTEAPMMISVLPRDEHLIDDPEKEKRVFGSCGRPNILCEVKIESEGKEVERGSIGEIAARCPNLMDGYLKNPEATAETIKEGWLYTGDLGRLDKDGYLFILDRSKDMIVSGGFNIYPKEIEDLLFEHQAVKNVAVVGVPDDKWGEAVKAIVVLKNPGEASSEELIAFVKERKGSLVAPKSVDFWPEIPLTNLGKIDKKRIRNEYWKDHDRRI